MAVLFNRGSLIIAALALVFAGMGIQPALAQEGFCQKGISLQKVERLSGQGIGEGKLELTVKASIPSRGVSASTGRLILGSGGVQSPDMNIGTLWVPMDGSGYKQTLRTEITEHEVGKDKFVGGPDFGDDNYTVAVNCGSTQTVEREIKVKGRKTAKVKVTYVIGPLDREYGQAEQALQGGNAVRVETVTRETATDRPGRDYRNFDLDHPNPGLCAQACAEDDRCEAYTYVSPGRQGPNARCWLKNQVPGSRSQSGLVSGVKVDARVPMNQNLNLPGKDYRNFDLQEAKPSLCAYACAVDPRCDAYTYVKPGVQGNQARCWLKNAVPQRVSGNCCVSGVKETL